LLERYQSPEQIFGATENDLGQTGVPRPTVRNILAFNDFDPIEKERCELPRIGARLVRWTDPDYLLTCAVSPTRHPISSCAAVLTAKIPGGSRSLAARTVSDAGRRRA
jgi:hypothetical protein